MRLIDKRFKISRRDMLRTGGAVAAAAAVAPTGVISGKVFAAEPVALPPRVSPRSSRWRAISIPMTRSPTPITLR